MKPIDLVLKHTGEDPIAVIESAVHKSSDEGVSRVCRERAPDDSQLTQMVEASSCNLVDVSLQRQIIVNHNAEVTDVRSRLDGNPRDVEFTNRAVLQPPRGSKPDQLRL